MSKGVIPELKMYGYCITWRCRSDKPDTPGALPLWRIEQCDEYLNLPAHYPSLDEALDRAESMRSKGVDARVVALVAEPTDTPEVFERNKIDG